MDTNRSVFVEATTWSRDHDLFDYESSNVSRVNLAVNTLGTEFCDGLPHVVRNKSDVQVFAGPSPDKDATNLVRLVWRGQHPVVQRHAGSKRLWQVVRELPDKGHRLQEGDMVKLGRVRVRVRQVAISPEDVFQPVCKSEGSEAAEVVVCNQQHVQDAPCRICLSEGGEEGNPLIAPCNCCGSVQYVHVDCLRHWISERLHFTASDETDRSFFYKQLTCELCHANYPIFVKDGGHSAMLAEVPEVSPPFVVLEQQPMNGVQSGMYVLSLSAGKVIRLGRGHSVDVRIPDVSISRCHATIRMDESGHCVLEDSGSKFGTLVAVRSSRGLELTDNLVLQVEHTVLRLSRTPIEPHAPGTPSRESSGEGLQDEDYLCSNEQSA
mmetsp:Transcript_35932/g.86512  ORF Transcript_35932/g.86512 Transcript_35932/m.86512 type:complete len:380 (+) Transcript_35932:38-1177(+)